MNLFWKKRFGGMLSTSKFEKMEEAAVSDMKRYDEIAKSLELEEYRKLFHVVKSSEFKEKKKTLQNRKYQDTEEYRISRKYQKLHTNSSIRQYYETLHSERLNTFLDFKTTPEYEELGDKKKVKASEKLQKLKDFENSKEYKNYIRYHDSFIIRDYEELNWYINDLEVHRTTSNVPKENLYLGFNSFLPAKEKPSTGKLEVDWVKVLSFN